MSEKDNILGRIREALKVEAHVPGTHGGDHSHPALGSIATDARKWMPVVGASADEQFALFAKNSDALKAEFLLVDSIEAARQALVAVKEREKWSKIASHSGELTNSICPTLNLPLLHTDKAYDVQALEACDAGISECDALIAQTGTVLVTNRTAGGRALSVLPPHHVVLARRSQMVADLPAAFALLKQRYAANYPSMISFITGPSRTGDIERILVLGAHGPKKLTIICF